MVKQVGVFTPVANAEASINNHNMNEDHGDACLRALSSATGGSGGGAVGCCWNC